MGSMVSQEIGNKTMLTRRLAIVSFLGLTLLGAGNAAPAFATEERDIRAARQVLQLTAEASAVLQRRDLSPIELRAALAGVLHQHFDIRLIARAALGKAWRRASAVQHRLYLEAFDRYLVQIIVQRLAGRSDLRLAVTGVAAAGKQDSYVKTNISRADGARIKAVWRLRTSSAGPKVIDVVIEGISLVLTKRAEFATVIRRAGIDGLIEGLQRKAQPTPSAEMVAASSN